jgi:hypothetical protein
MNAFTHPSWLRLLDTNAQVYTEIVPKVVAARPKRC